MTKKGVDWISDIVGFEVYEELDPSDRMSFQIGQVYLAPVKYSLTPARILEVQHYNPEKEEETTFKIAHYKPNEPSQEIPLKSLNLKSDDRFFILQGKRRPVIVLGNAEADWLFNFKLNSGPTEKLVLCLPVFTFKERHTQEYVMRIQAFSIPNLFYIYPSPKGFPKEGAARFELIQPIHKGDMQPLRNINNRPYRLSDYTLKLLWYHLTSFLSIGTIDESLKKDLQAYQELVLEEL